MNPSVFLQERARIFLFFRKTEKNEAYSATLFRVFAFAVFPEKRTFDRKLPSLLPSKLEAISFPLM